MKSWTRDIADRSNPEQQWNFHRNPGPHGGCGTFQLGNAPDERALRAAIERGLDRKFGSLRRRFHGQYDLVEQVLAISAPNSTYRRRDRPGRPAVLQHAEINSCSACRNPVSTMVTFELFVLPAIDL
jgi:molybdopterin biosynthesis enzyme